ncbi:MAG: HAMP domain-containing sensor histidine kinase [Terracidiphilus sp.]|nr:HAMP domain-containing sensor histidine kinase [Terracidiphilus sp.]
MPDYYHGPALALTALFLPAFGYLYYRYRDIRTFLWFLAFLFAVVPMLIMYGGEYFPELLASSWSMAAMHSALLTSSVLFLASMSPLKFRVGNFEILYALPYGIPLVLCTILYIGVFQGQNAGQAYAFPLLGGVALVAAIAWNAQKGAVPVPITLTVAISVGLLCYWVFFTHGAEATVVLIQSANLLFATLLVAFVFRRFTPGVLLSMAGLLAWSLHSVELFPVIVNQPALYLTVVRVAVLGRVVAAVGMILLVLEDELSINLAAREREQRERSELAAYAGLVMARRRVEDLDRLGGEICAAVAENSRFSQAALLLDKEGHYRLSGSAGFERATAEAINSVAMRIPVQMFPVAGVMELAVEQSQTYRLDPTPWLEPGDDLEQTHVGPILAIPMQGRTATEGMLLLGGERKVDGNAQLDQLRRDDLRPVEQLAARLQAVRSQTKLFEKLVDSERYAGVGQLASNVTQQLNNPLTVILGYASLLEGDATLDMQERRGIGAILAEARRMRSTLETLLRISAPNKESFAAVSVVELLTDMEQLCRTEFLQQGIEFSLNMAEELPRVLCNAQQLRQAVLHCLQFSLATLRARDIAETTGEPKRIRLEAHSEGGMVQIQIAHSGEGFVHPERAFDPFAPTLPGEETVGLGLSLCASILRENNGRASAVNLAPRGAAILLELPVA